jgi:hypothetical protein
MPSQEPVEAGFLCNAQGVRAAPTGHGLLKPVGLEALEEVLVLCNT